MSEHDFIRTAEVVGNVARTAYNVGKFVVDRLFTSGGWVFDMGDKQYNALMEHMDNVIRGEE